MRNAIPILGTLLITVLILISGSAVAPWVTVYSSSGTCTNLTNIEGADDGKHATIGQNPSTLGWVVLDLGAGGAMGPSQDFTVYSDSVIEETYALDIAETPEDDAWFLGIRGDTEDHDFTTPSTPGYSWRYIIIRGWSGNTGPGDLIYGPEIDAIGY